VLFHKNSLHDRPKGLFLDRICEESERYAEEVGEDLQDNVFRALRVLARGFTEEDDLDIDLTSEEDLEKLKENSLVFLYRVMFILYAEGKDLISPEESMARKRYERNFSLEEKRIEILEDVGHSEDFELYEKNRYEIWDRLYTLFNLIDEGNDKLDITAYNGGLFATEEHQFISENRVSDYYLAQVIYYLSATTSNGELVPVRYSDLNTRHLGSVYEGLLEHQFKEAAEDLAAVEDDGNEVWKSADSVDEADAIETVEEGELYVANDDDERRTTGSYYTPEYVVRYIIEETVAPLLEDIEEQLQKDGFDPEKQEYVDAFASKVRELSILDPAMGSGHFLTSLINYITEKVQKSARNAGVSGIIDEENYRRLVAKEVVYGTDNNEMAVELAKVSMWLETLAVDQPLAFLDHHLKIGNSVLGSNIDSLEELAATQRRDEDQSGLDDFDEAEQNLMSRLMDIYKEFITIENTDRSNVEDIKEKYREYEQKMTCVNVSKLWQTFTRQLSLIEIWVSLQTP
jgi:type I restriction-modification system DNA methylase subunit